MTKYYRVRTQEQWDWLKNKLEIEDDLHVSDFPMTLLYGDVFCGIYKYHDDPEPLIEVSQMMEDEKMEDYVEIKGRDIFKIKDEENLEAFCYSSDTNESNNSFDLISYINELHIPKSLLYPKVPMTEAEKKEFDNIDKNYSVSNALDETRKSYDYPALHKKIYEHTSSSIKEFELEFARAWVQPSLIEVIKPDKFYVKVPLTENDYYIKEGGELTTITGKINSREKFTAEELEHHGLEDETIYKRVEVSE